MTFKIILPRSFRVCVSVQDARPPSVVRGRTHHLHPHRRIIRSINCTVMLPSSYFILVLSTAHARACQTRASLCSVETIEKERKNSIIKCRRWRFVFGNLVVICLRSIYLVIYTWIFVTCWCNKCRILVYSMMPVILKYILIETESQIKSVLWPQMRIIWNKSINESVKY